MEKFDPDVVREFYANAGKEKRERKQGYKSFVRGTEIDYSPTTLAQLLGVETWTEEESDYYYDRLRGRHRPLFEIEELEQCLCLPGREASWNTARTKKTIIRRKHMTQRAKIWMHFMLHNLVPNTHSTDVTVDIGCLLFCLVQNKDIDVARLIAESIQSRAYSSAATGTIGYPALITLICMRAGVPGIRRTRPIKTPIDESYISRECREDTGPPPPRTPTTTPLEQKLDHIIRQNDFIMDRQDCLMRRHLHTHQGVRSSYALSFPGHSFLMSPEDLQATFPWPEDRPHMAGGAEPAAGPHDDDPLPVPGDDIGDVLGEDMEHDAGV